MNISHLIYKWKSFSGKFVIILWISSRIEFNDLFFLLRILVDAAQTPNTKTKIAELKFLTNLATTYCRSDDFPKTPTTSKAVLKLVQMANDQKSVELRGQARSCLVALYNCCTADVSFRYFKQNELSTLTIDISFLLTRWHPFLASCRSHTVTQQDLLFNSIYDVEHLVRSYLLSIFFVNCRKSII